MQPIIPKVTFKSPYAMLHLQQEVKNHGERFNPDKNEGNSALVTQLAFPPPRPPAPAELLNALKIGTFVLIESSPTRVVIEKAPTA